MKTYEVTRTLKSYLTKTIEVPDDTDLDEVCEMAWNSNEPWVSAGSRDIDCECEEQ